MWYQQKVSTQIARVPRTLVRDLIKYQTVVNDIFILILTLVTTRQQKIPLAHDRDFGPTPHPLTYRVNWTGGAFFSI
jgi:hypothetical protein